MSDTGPAVALLFDDTELGGQLREALHERGARIVHEGGVSSLSRELLQRVGAEVLVVNLDDTADDALDQLYEVIDGDRPRVVFNDAQASRTLVGWDRARWARHLAVKVLAVGEVDPPRPADARGIQEPLAAPIDAADVGAASLDVPAEAAQAAAIPGAETAKSAAAAELPREEQDPEMDVHGEDGGQSEQSTITESESLAAELEALLASGELPVGEENESGSGLRYADGEDLPPLHDGNFGGSAATSDAMPSDQLASPGVEVDEFAENSSGTKHPVFQLDHLQLTSMDDVSITRESAAAVAHIPAGATATQVGAHEGWELLDDEAPPVAAGNASVPKPDSAAFGVHKLSAADFLAPEVEQVAPGLTPVMSLQLVSMEEAIAPQAYVHENEMLLDDLGGALSRVVLLGAAVDGMDSVCVFLAALPPTTRLAFLHTQHLAGQSAAALVEQLAVHCALPVRLAQSGSRARVGEVLVVSAEQQVRLRRDGSIELQPNDTGTEGPSIDASFTMAAGAFGRDALAIVFAGRANDAVAGAQAIHDRGGQVWVESSSGEHFADMVSGIFAERLVSFSGTPHELAAHLIEVFP